MKRTVLNVVASHLYSTNMDQSCNVCWSASRPNLCQMLRRLVQQLYRLKLWTPQNVTSDDCQAMSNALTNRVMTKGTAVSWVLPITEQQVQQHVQRDVGCAVYAGGNLTTLGSWFRAKTLPEACLLWSCTHAVAPRKQHFDCNDAYTSCSYFCCAIH